MATLDNNKAKRAAQPALIRDPGDAVKGGGVSMLLLIPAVIVSAVLHVGLILGLFLIPGPSSGATPPTEPDKNETVVQGEPPPPPESKDPLLITEVDPAGAEPDAKINYDNDRKEEVSVPGVVNPDEPVGVLNGDKTMAPMNIPAPQGLGGGQGGALEGPIPGTGTAVGMPGGYSLRGMPLAGTFYGRSGSTRQKALREGGGTKETEAAVAMGLQWIARQQNVTGSWSLDGTRFKERGQTNDIAGTAFGLLPLLGAGYTHKKAKNSTENPYDKPIEKGLWFLIRKQDRKTGNFGGGMYAHALATIAMCEAYGLSQDPLLRRPAQMAVIYLVNAQHEAGGWRYGPKQAGDTSVTGWVVMALKSAQMANLDVPESTMKKAIRYIDSCCNKDTEGYGYTPPAKAGDLPHGSPTMSAVGLLCRQYLQSWGSQNLRMIKGVEKNIERVPPGAHRNMYYYYYATQVMHHFGGENWAKWNEKMRSVLLKNQEKSQVAGADVKGSWNPAGDAHAAAGGRLMNTSLSILTLEVYYRHLPLYYRDMGEKRLAGN